MTTRPNTTGLRYWMLRVLEECDQAAAGFRADPVHDLRVSLRRCRSMADGMMALDPDPAWKEMKKAGKKLFQGLGQLRDTQIMMEWIEKLSLAQSSATRTLASASSSRALPGQPESNETLGLAVASSNVTQETVQDPGQALLALLRHRETIQKQAARTALDQFDRKQWRQWSKTLPMRATRIRLGSPAFQHLALERWAAAHALHHHAMRNRSRVALHTLRIGVKRFRYIVENFLPTEHKLWSDDLKHMQDLLGEVHDMDVLWAAAISCHVFHDPESRRWWHERVTEERTKRVNEYRQRMVGPDSLWNLWRAGLPQGKRVVQIATQRMKLWAKSLDPDFAHSERVARLALELYDGLQSRALLGGKINGSNGKTPNAEERSALYMAALLHDVGKVGGEKGHQKESQALIKSHPAPLGWNAAAMGRAAVIARFHAGALPRRSHKSLRDLFPEEQKTIIRLAAILRLANAFDAEHDGRIRRIKIEKGVQGKKSRDGTRRFLHNPFSLAKNEALIIGTEGYSSVSRTAQAIAAERYLLETVLRHPIIVRPIAHAP